MIVTLMHLGITGLCDMIKSDPKLGLSEDNFIDRDEHFGSNYKAPPLRTRKSFSYKNSFLQIIFDSIKRFYA